MSLELSCLESAHYVYLPNEHISANIGLFITDIQQIMDITE